MPTLPDISNSTNAYDQHTECHLHVRHVVASVPGHSLGLPKIPSSPSAHGSHQIHFGFYDAGWTTQSRKVIPLRECY